MKSEVPPLSPDLAARYRAGDRDALVQIITTYEEAIRGLLGCRLRRRPDLIDDAFQEVFIALERSCAGYDPARSFPPWLGTIIRHRAVEVLRQYTPRNRNAAEVLRQYTLRKPIPENRVVDPTDKEKSRLLDAIQSLSPRPRKIISMFYLQEMPCRKIAAKLHLQAATVRSWLRHGRYQLSQIL